MTADPAPPTTLEECVATAIREEIVRQHREDERSKCPAGRDYYEEHISPWLIAKEAIAVVRQWDASDDR